MKAINKKVLNPWDALPRSSAFDWKSGIIFPPEEGQYVVFEPETKWVGTVTFYKKNNKWAGVNACAYFYSDGTQKRRFYWDYLPEDPENPKSYWNDIEDDYGEYDEYW